MNDDRQQVGEHGEELAREYLEENGYRILDENYENDQGELDLIAHEPSTDVFVFVEVRTRKENLFRAERSIDGEKREQVVQTASRFLARRNALGVPHRFDVIGVTLHDDEPPDIRHHKSAFSR
jgi:putative endonuclease